jgi:hypothetical protein
VVDQKAAKQLVEEYVEGWKRNDSGMIANTLSANCVVIESHGTTYRELEIVRRWVESWFAEGSRIDRWDITRFYYLEDVAVFEWDFVCVVDGKEYQLQGVGIVEFDDDRIVTLREYRRTEMPYDWSA